MHSVTLVLKIILRWMEFENMEGCKHPSAINWRFWWKQILTQKLSGEQTLKWFLYIWIELDCWRSLIHRCYTNWTKTRKYCYEICFSAFLHNKNNPFFDVIMTCDKKWIFYNNQQIQHGSWTEMNIQNTPQSCRKKFMVYGDCLVAWYQIKPI